MVFATRTAFSSVLSSRRRHTRCLSDWSSDVCSSDLSRAPERRRSREHRARGRRSPEPCSPRVACSHSSRGGSLSVPRASTPVRVAADAGPRMSRSTRMTGSRAILALFLILAPAVASRAKAEGSSLSIPKGTIRTGDVVVLGRPFFLEGELEGSAVLVGGASAVVLGRIRRDLILLGADATIRRGARIGGDVLCVGGSLTFEETPGGHSSNATASATPSQVGGRVRTITALEAAVVSELETSPMTSGKTSPLVLSFRLFLLFCWLVVSIGLLFLAPRPVLQAVDETRGRVAFLAVLGATAVLTAVFLAAFALSVLPARFALVLGVALLGALAAAKIFGLAVLFVFRSDRGFDRSLPRGVRAVRPAGPVCARPRRRVARSARRREDLRSRGAFRRPGPPRDARRRARRSPLRRPGGARGRPPTPRPRISRAGRRPSRLGCRVARGNRRLARGRRLARAAPRARTLLIDPGER